LRKYVLGGLVAVAVVLAAQIILHRKQAKKTAAGPFPPQSARAGNDSEYYRIEQYFAGLDLARNPSETPRQWLRRLRAVVGESIDTLETVVHLHYRYRFDPDGIAPEERTALQQQSAAWLEQARAKA
jgi:protein-glutamine gamma-glutamyltransferase